MLFRAATIVTLTLLAIVGGGPQMTAAKAANYLNPNFWIIGPIIRGKNYSIGMPLHPTLRDKGGFYIDLPEAPDSAHYVTFRHGSLAGKRRIRMRYRIQAEPRARIIASSDSKSAAIITPYFQRRGDNWTARGRFETYRWYGTFATKVIEPGVFEIVAPLDAKWTAIETSDAYEAPTAFRDAVIEADQVGFVLGGGDGHGHGVHVTGGAARLIVTEFRVE